MVAEPSTSTDTGQKNGTGPDGPKLPKGWPRWMVPFLIELATRGIVGHAADHAGVSRDTCYDYRRKPKYKAFKLLWDEAIETAYDRMEQVAIDRATDHTAPGFEPGPSNGLLKWLLEAYRPAKFKRDKGMHVGPVYVLKVGDFPQRQIRDLADLEGLTDRELEVIAGADLELEEGDYTVLNGEEPDGG